MPNAILKLKIILKRKSILLVPLLMGLTLACFDQSLAQAQSKQGDWIPPNVGPAIQTSQNNLSPLAPIADSTTPDEFVRSQIGLVSFKEAIATDSNTAPAHDEPSATSPITDLFSAEQFTSPQGLGSSLKAILLIATLSLAPAIILMTTCYVRVIVVLTLLKQAFGAQQLPPMQVLTALSLFITLLVMTPVWNQIKTEAIDPYTQSENGISWNEAWERGVVPVKTFMGKQIDAADNDDSIALFYEYLPPESTGTLVSQGTASYQQANETLNPQDIPLNVLLPAFVISELKVAFLLGFQIYLPFLVLDLVVSSVTVSSGMMMLPPTMVSFPLKLIMFVLVDGWNLVVGMLLQSFATFG